ncbi:MAG: hypothetical protein AAF089_10520 [Bacteroidota bacterium]
MAQVCIPIPPLQEGDTLDVEVIVNGERRLMQYRVEAVDIDPSVNRAEALRLFIDAYEPGWRLINIGMPSGMADRKTRIPVMFRQQEAPADDYAPEAIEPAS